MPEPTWYFIGPDKTGFDCPNCCYGFSDVDGECVAAACPTASQSFRNYLCPNSTYPTPQHIYAWDDDGYDRPVSIRPNSHVCRVSSTTCYSYSPLLINAAGRVGSGCSQTTVTPEYLCLPDFGDCPPLDCEEGCVPMGNIVYPEYCSITGSGCHCASSSSYANCYCHCPSSSCFFNQCSTSCRGEIVTFCCEDDTPICDCSGDPPSECGSCGFYCTYDGYYECRPSTCSPSCSEGFSCSCGECLCNTSSTCCVGTSAGWVYVSSVSATYSTSSLSGYCKPCYSGWQDGVYSQPPNEVISCCYLLWKQKNCEEDEWCCNDGRCYQSKSILCDFWPPPLPASASSV